VDERFVLNDGFIFGGVLSQMFATFWQVIKKSLTNNIVSDSFLGCPAGVEPGLF